MRFGRSSFAFVLRKILILSLAAASFGCGGGGGGLQSGAGGSAGGGGGGIADSLPGGNTAFPPGADTPNPGDTPPDEDPGTPVAPGGPGSAGDGGSQAEVVVINLDPGGGGGTQRTIERTQVTVQGTRFAGLNLNLANTNAFQIVAQSNDDALRTDRLFDPDGNIVFDALDEFPWKSLAGQYDRPVNVVSYEADASDADVVEGTYLQSVSLFASTAGTIQLAAIAKNDPNFGGGVLRVNIFYLGTEANEDDSKRAVAAGLDQWRAIYSAIGITLNVQEIDVPGNSGILPDPSAGNALYVNLAQDPQAQQFAVNVAIGEEIQTNIDNPGLGLLGIAGGIPGAGIPTSRSVVVASLVTAAGPDGVFNVDEQTLLGETMAHEAGHYLGLFHPVQNTLAGDDFVEGDVLGDTGTCGDVAECVATGIAQNLMFPTALQGVRQTVLSGEQGGVINRQAIVD